MDRKEITQYIITNICFLDEINKKNLLLCLHRDKVKISESADGSRIWLDRVNIKILRKIYNYVKDIIDRDSEYFLSVSSDSES